MPLRCPVGEAAAIALPLHRAACSEPPTPLSPIRFRGRLIPKGTTILVSPFLIQRDPANWVRAQYPTLPYPYPPARLPAYPPHSSGYPLAPYLNLRECSECCLHFDSNEESETPLPEGGGIATLQQQHREAAGSNKQKPSLRAPFLPSSLLSPPRSAASGRPARL